MKLPRFGSIFRLIGSWARGWDRAFYVTLAVAVALLTSLDLFLFRTFSNADNGIYDTLIKYRLSSPPPSPDILIVDIDERSLEVVGQDYGRWPWPRSVIAEVIAGIGEAGPKVAIVNILFSEPVLDDPAGDEALSFIAEAYPQVVFPFVRLPPANDSQSELITALIPGSRLVTAEVAENSDTVAVVLPGLAGLQRRIGASNLETDEDGIVRAYRYWYSTSTHEIPSLAAAAVLYGGGMESRDSGKRLNWRNKTGEYTRISFADLYLAVQGQTDFDWGMFSGKYVVMGPTAPGISIVKPTSASSVMDDNTILATAIDDQLSSTGLGAVADWALALSALLLILLICWAFLSEISEGLIDGIFVVAQTILVGITFWSVSYTNVVIDLTLVFNAGLLFFLVGRAFLIAKSSSELGSDLFWNQEFIKDAELVLTALIPATGKSLFKAGEVARLQRQLDELCGKERVLRFHKVADEGTFFGPVVGGKSLLVAFLRADQSAAVKALFESRPHPTAVNWRVQPISGLPIEEMRRLVWTNYSRQLVE